MHTSRQADITLRGAARASLALCATLLLSFAAFADGTSDQLAAKTSFDLPAQPLGISLKQLANQAGIQILFEEKAVDGFQAPALKARESAADALKILLSHTDLEYSAKDRTVAVRRRSSAPATSLSSYSDSVEKVAAIQTDDTGQGTLRLTQASPGSSAEGTQTDSDGSRAGPLEEIVVTAQKRSENLMDVPMSLTALSGDQLERTQSYRTEDFVGKVPGLLFFNNGGGGSELVIRGLTLGSADANSGVAVYIDDTPFTPSGPWSGATFAAPDLDAFDMQRIEVLKGPQGTLYGANALGGLLKYVTNAPDPSGFAARAETGVSSVSNGGAGFDVHAMVNIPLGSEAALRIVGYENYYPGFIDDPSRNQKDINGDRFSGGRASLIYDPTGDLSIRVNALYQDQRADDYGNGAEDVNPVTLRPIYGNLTQERLIGQPSSQTSQLYNLTVNWNAGFAKLLSTSSYALANFVALSDLSPGYSVLTPPILGGNYGVAYPQYFSYDTFTQEARLSSVGNGPLEWQVGGYFSDNHSDIAGALFPIDPSTRTILYGNFGLGAFSQPASYRESAAFANLDYHLTSAFDVALGGRYSKNNQTYEDYPSGPILGSQILSEQSSQGAFTYSGDARWHITPDHMLYARIAEGFVPGGPNNTFPGSTLPSSYNSSTTVNYEAGIKSILLDNHLSVELSVFYIDWRDIALTVSIDGLGAYANAGTARSQGSEWNFVYAPVGGLTLSLNGAYTEAYLTQVLPSVPGTVGANVGNRLPFVPTWESSASAEYERRWGGGYSGFTGLSWRFTGTRDANFETAAARLQVPSFSIFDARAGVEKNSWAFTLYAKNIANKIAINYLSDETFSGSLGPQSAVLYQPRTIGATVTAKF